MTFDYKKEYKEFYMPKGTPSIVRVPKMNYIAVRGSGNPNDADGEYKQSIGLLYGIAFTIKMSKKEDHQIDGYFDYVVHSLISNIQCISLFFHKSVHLIYCSRLIVIRSDMHTLYTQTFIIRKELNFGEILFLFLRSFSDCPVKIFPANKIRQANNRNPLEFFLARIIDS